MGSVVKCHRCPRNGKQRKSCEPETCLDMCCTDGAEGFIKGCTMILSRSLIPSLNRHL